MPKGKIISSVQKANWSDKKIAWASIMVLLLPILAERLYYLSGLD
jgi:hypothetical protein